MNTAVATQKWSRQHESYGPGWAEAYWGSQGEPSRARVLEALAGLEWTTLVELGCNSGPMLNLIRGLFPDAAVVGVEVNPQAVLACRQREIPVEEADLMSWLPRQPAQSWDIVLTHYTLAYVAPVDLAAVLAQCARLARVAIICAEPTAGVGTPAGMVYAYPEWRHDYVQILTQFIGRTPEVIPVTPPVGHLNAVVVARTAANRGGDGRPAARVQRVRSAGDGSG